MFAPGEFGLHMSIILSNKKSLAEIILTLLHIEFGPLNVFCEQIPPRGFVASKSNIYIHVHSELHSLE